MRVARCRKLVERSVKVPCLTIRVRALELLYSTLQVDSRHQEKIHFHSVKQHTCAHPVNKEKGLLETETESLQVSTSSISVIVIGLAIQNWNVNMLGSNHVHPTYM